MAADHTTVELSDKTYSKTNFERATRAASRRALAGQRRSISLDQQKNRLARDQLCAAMLDDGECSKAVPFDFEDEVRVIEL